MLQQWIAGLMVALAAAYALWYWLPAGLRRRLGRVQKKLGEKPGCSACSSCEGCGTKAQSGPISGGAGSSGESRAALWMQPRP